VVSPPNGERFFQPAWNIVTPGYFGTVGIRIVAGRDFGSADRSGADRVAIISEAAARRFWPGQHAIGQQIVWHKAPRLVSRDRSAASQMVSMHLTVVGVAADVYMAVALLRRSCTFRSRKNTRRTWPSWRGAAAALV
jgi:hypothetical protein